MMRWTAAFAIGVALLGASSSAQSAGLFDTFKTICIDTNANLNATLAAADAAGWIPTAQPRIVQNMPADVLLLAAGASAKMDFRSTKDHKYLLIVAEGRSEFSPTFAENTCLLLVPKGAISQDFVGQAATLADVPRKMPTLSENDGGESVREANTLFAFYWREENGKHVRADPYQSRGLKGPVDSLVVTRTEMPIALFSIASKRN